MTTALQDALFDPAASIDRVSQPRVGQHHRNASKTERAAAQAIVKVSGKRRREVLSVIVDAGITGITRQEIADMHGLPIQSVCGRVKELLDAGFIQQSWRERQGRSILYFTDRGQRALRASS